MRRLIGISVICLLSTALPCIHASAQPPQSDGFLRKDGAVLFPIGCYELPADDAALQAMGEAGINLVRCHTIEDLDRAQAAGMLAWAPLGVHQGATDALRDQVNRLKDHPAVAVWEGPDEIVWNFTAYSQLYKTAGLNKGDWWLQTPKAVAYAEEKANEILPKIRAGIQLVRELDPHDRLFWFNEARSSDVEYVRGYLDLVDVTGCDDYPVRVSGESDLHRVGRATQHWRAVGGDMPVWMVLQAFAWSELGEESASRGGEHPAFRESRFMAYDVIAQGARGVLYWGSHYNKEAAFWESILALTSELAALQRFLVAPQEENIRVTLIEPPDEPAVGVRLIARRHGDDWLIALVNEDNRNHFGVEVSRLDALEGKSLYLLYDSETKTIQNGEFITRMLPYQVKVFATSRDWETPRRRGRGYDPKNAEPHARLYGAVKAYADAMLDHGRDSYGPMSSPLFAAALDRSTLKLLEGPAYDAVLAMPREAWGIRPHDRILSGANPMHDQNLYQVLHALTAASGDKRYAAGADAALRWFLQNCQSDATGLLAWGEHMGWDFRTETLVEKDARLTHEFFRPWRLWPRCFELAPDAAARFATGLWEHQIGDYATGNFSRHARYDAHGPGINSEYPRHGGFYILTWANAYAKTRDPLYVNAIETLVNYFENRRNPESGALPAESAERSKGTTVWPPSNLSLSIDLHEGAQHVPPELAARMLESARRNDNTFLRLPHDLGPEGKGFVTGAITATLEPSGYSGRWATGYGDYTDAQIANFCAERYRQCGAPGYRALTVAAARRYMDSAPDIEFPVYPGTLGDVIWLMLDAHELSGEYAYVERADYFADRALEMFFTEGCPLPKASDKADHYEAITRADSLMMAMLRLWLTHNGGTRRCCLLYTDR